jgi:homoserine O-acetyltransferase
MQTLDFADFITERGDPIAPVTVAYETWGALNAAADNAVVLCHALTGTADAAAWMAPLVGPGRLFDPAHHFVVCQNVLGSCYGTTGPGSSDPRTGRRRGSAFPIVSVADQVRLQRLALDRLGVRGVRLAYGGSLGGMQALEWAAQDGRVERVVAVGCGRRHEAWQIGFGEAQRQAIYADARWRGGDFDPDSPPADGLAAARAVAMLTYRTPSLYAERFGRERQREGDDAPFAVESYLRYQGQKLADRFDAGAYVRLTQAMDRFDLDAAAVRCPALAVGISSDLLYPPGDARALAQALPDGRYAEIATDFGHDAFLVDFDGVGRAVRPFLEQSGFFDAQPNHR